MGKIVGAILAAGCFFLISALWLSALALLGAVLMRIRYAFDAFDVAVWLDLYRNFQQGGTIPFGFLLSIAGMAILAAIGEATIVWRLPTIVASMPSPSLPRFSRPKMRVKPSQPRPRIEPVVPQPAPPPPAPLEGPPPAQSTAVGDDIILARILSLFEVWNEPPPAWMTEALRDEVMLLSPGAWPTLESLGSQGLDLLLTLQEHDMLPEGPAALRAIGEVEAVLRTGIAAELSNPGTAQPAPALTLAAAWLCEALENFLAGQSDAKAPAERIDMAQSMLKQAMRGMGDPDWASLDLFPEKASRVRVLTDRFREDMRQDTVSRTAVAATPLEAVIAVLTQFGFNVESAVGGLDTDCLFAHRADLKLLLQTIDLAGKNWRLPQGALGPWANPVENIDLSPGRQLWQRLARRRLRDTDPRPLAGLLVLHGGSVEQEEALARMVAADRRRSGISLVWLGESESPLPTLNRQLAELPELMLQDLRRGRAAGHSALQP